MSVDDEAGRAIVLGRISEALASGPRTSALPEPMRPAPGAGDPDLWRRRVEDYGATVTTTAPGGIADALGAACRRHRAGWLAVADDVPESWLPPGPAFSREGELDLEGLDAVDGSLYGCAWGIAETGTVVLDGGPRQGSRLLSLIPDLSLCVVFAEQLVADLPQLFMELGEDAAKRPVTFVSGPSATSDIELSRVEGVHGPRRFELVLVV